MSTLRFLWRNKNLSEIIITEAVLYLSFKVVNMTSFAMITFKELKDA